jgi:hypothetical protein
MDKTPGQVAQESVDAFVAKCEIVRPDGSTGEDYERDLEIPIAQAIEAAIASAQATINQLRCTIDRLDCTVREGGQTLHCPVDNQCLQCRFRSAQAKIE